MKLARGWLIAFSVAGALVATGWIGATLGVSGQGIAVALTIVALVLVGVIGLLGALDKRKHDRS